MTKRDLTKKLPLICSCLVIGQISTSVQAAHFAELTIDNNGVIQNYSSGPDPLSATASTFFPSFATIGGDQSGNFGTRMNTQSSGYSAEGLYRASNFYVANGGSATFNSFIDAGSMRMEYHVHGNGGTLGELYAGFEYRVLLNGSVVYEVNPYLSTVDGINVSALGFNMTKANVPNPTEFSYSWDAFNLSIDLGNFNPGEVFNLTYEIESRVGMFGTTFCGPFEGPNPVNCTELSGAGLSFSDPAGVQQHPLMTGATITAVPVPPAFGLFALGLLTLLSRRIKR